MVNEQQKYLLMRREDEEVGAERRFDGEIEAPARGRGERLGKFSLVVAATARMGRRDSRTKDQLARCARRLRENGTQTLMPLDQIGEGGFEGVCGPEYRGCAMPA